MSYTNDSFGLSDEEKILQQIRDLEARVDQLEKTEVPRASTIQTGWVSLGKTLTYASSVSATYPATASPDGGGGVIYTVNVATGMKLRFKQGADYKYFYITGVSLDGSSGITTVGITGGSDYVIVDQNITDVSYSYVDMPTGFPHWFNWTPALGGFSSDPTNATYRFRIDGAECSINVYQGTAGTSDATNFTISVPIISQNISQNALALYVDNGTQYEGEGYVQIGQDESRLVLGTSGGALGWTSSGNKSASFQIGYEIKSTTTVPTTLYAEVSFEGQSELTCIIPTEHEANIDIRAFGSLTAVASVAHAGQTQSGEVDLAGESSLTASSSVASTATIYYVDATGGSDGNGGQSTGDAWQTITKVNSSSFNVGDTIKFKRGETWTGTTLTPPSSGNVDNYIVFEDYGSHDNLPIIQAGSTGEALNIAASQQYLEFNNIHFKGGSDTAQPVVDVKRPYINFNDCVISDGLYIGFVIYSSTGVDTHHINVIGCESYGHTKHGFYCSSSDGTAGPHDVLFQDCIAHDNGVTVYTDHGFYVAFGTTLDGCVAYDNYSAGIKVNSNLQAGSSYAPIVKNCLSYSNVDGLYIGHYDCLFVNNVVYDNTSYNIKFDSEGDNNKFYFNTIVNSTHNNFEAIDIGSTSETGNIFKSNLFIQDSSVTLSMQPQWHIDGSVSDFLSNNTIDYNLYYRSGLGVNDVIMVSDVDGNRTFAQIQSAGGETNGSCLSSPPALAVRYTDLRPIDGGNVDNFNAFFVQDAQYDINGIMRIPVMSNPGAYMACVIRAGISLEGQSSLTATGGTGLVYYVDATDGSDGENGLTEETAWQTLTKVNNSSFNAGDTIKFKRGETWTGELVPPSSGTSGNPITFEDYGDATNRPIIQADVTGRAMVVDNSAQHYLEFNHIHFKGDSTQTVYLMTSYIDFYDCYFSDGSGGLVIYGNNDSGASIHHINVIDCVSYNSEHQGFLCTPYPDGQYGPHDVLFQGCTAYNNGTVDYSDHGFYVSFGCTIDSCVSYGNHYAGFKVNCEGYQTSSYSPIVKNSISYDNACGLYVGNVDSLFYNNVVYGNTEANLVCDSDAHDCEFYFNTFVNAEGSGNAVMDISPYSEAPGCIFKNNLFIQDSSVNSQIPWGTDDSLTNFAANITLDYNIYYRAGTGSTENVMYSAIDGNRTFANLQSAGLETNSTIFTSLPDFASRYTDLRPLESGNIATFDGTPITGITTDINGYERDSTPVPGAYEGVVQAGSSVSFEGESSLTASGYIEGEEPDIPLTGLVGWYEADAISGLVDNDNVATWEDSHTTDFDLTAYNSRYPVYKTNIKNSLPVVRFVAANLDTLNNSETGFEDAYRNKGYGAFFIVEKTNNTTTQEDTFIFQTPTSTGRFGMENNGDNTAGTFSVFSRVSDSQPNSDKLFTSAGYNDGDWHIVSALVYWVEGKAWVRVDGEQVAEDLSYCTPGNTPDTRGNRTYVGSSGGASFMDGDIAELILYNTEISASVARDIEEYLADKWGIELATATTHNAQVNLEGQSSLTAQPVNATLNGEVSLDGESTLTITGTASGQTLFEKDMEAGDWSDWTTHVGAGLTVSGSAGLNSTNYGLAGYTNNGGSNYAYSDFTASTTGILRLRFYIDRNDLSMSTGTMYMLGFKSSSDATLGYVRFYYDGANYNLQWQVYNDAGITDAVDGVLGTGEHYVEVQLERASNSTSSDGTAEIWIDGISQESISNIDNYDRFDSWDYLSCGVFSIVAGTTGTIYLDEIVANDTGDTIGA